MSTKHATWYGLLASGTVLAAVLLALVARAQTAPDAPMSDNGRFQIYIHPEVGKFQYLLDTRTGTVWVPKVFDSSDPAKAYTAWEKMGRIDTLDAVTFEGVYRANNGRDAWEALQKQSGKR